MPHLWYSIVGDLFTTSCTTRKCNKCMVLLLLTVTTACTTRNCNECMVLHLLLYIHGLSILSTINCFAELLDKYKLCARPSSFCALRVYDAVRWFLAFLFSFCYYIIQLCIWRWSIVYLVLRFFYTRHECFISQSLVSSSFLNLKCNVRNLYGKYSYRMAESNITKQTKPFLDVLKCYHKYV